MRPVSDVRIETRFTPAVDVAPFASGGAPAGPASWFASLMRPTITVNPDAGLASYVIAPYGESHGEWFPLLLALLVAGAVVAASLVAGAVVKRRA